MTKRIVLLQALAAWPRAVAEKVQELDEQALHYRPEAGQWTVTEVLRHLLYVERLYLIRLRRVVNEERPELPYIPPQQASADPPAGLQALLEQLAEARRCTLEYLQSLPAGAWRRPAVHQHWGETTFSVLVQALVDHDAEHLNQLTEILRQTEAV